MFLDFIPDFLVDSFVIRILLSALLGAAIGLERDIRGRSAGLRTNILVSLGSAVFMLLSISLAEKFSGNINGVVYSVDPTRIAAQVVTGIGFLGAGAIIKFGLSIRGLTTAACLWIASAIGMCCGVGYYDVAVLTTFISIIVLTLLIKVERLYSKDTYRVLEITCMIDTDVQKLLRSIELEGNEIIYFDEEKDYRQEILKLTINIRIRNREMTDNTCHKAIKALEKSGLTLYSIAWKHQ
jgi:putative Mg2+ transporter-C (MgtC) family protein